MKDCHNENKLKKKMGTIKSKIDSKINENFMLCTNLAISIKCLNLNT